MRALITFGLGPARELLDIARPSFEEFAERHGYELRVYEPEASGWPIPWAKVACIDHALHHGADEVLWVDSDIVIIDASEDIPIEDGKWQALAVHHTQDGEVPNTGVWLCRPQMKRYLSKLWDANYRHHPWWEQGSLMSHLGYDSWARPTHFHGPTELYERTTFLSTEWNSHPWDEAEHPRFMHATMREPRAEIMREWAV